MYKLREARYDDFSMISTIINTTENIHLSVAEDQIEKDFYEETMEEENRKLYLVEKTGKIIAFLLFRIDSQRGIIYIEKLSIDRDFKKKGLDEHLYHKIERFAEKKGIKQLFVTITTKDLDVHDFFERKGWTLENDVYVCNMKELDKE